MNSKTYEGATSAELKHPMVSQFLAIHNMFRSELANMLRFVDALLVEGQSLQQAETAGYIQTLAQATYRYTHYLHFHHHHESSGLFPELRKEGLEDGVIQRLEREHDEIASLISQLEGTLLNAAAIDPQVINSDLQRLSESLSLHLAYEESHVCPLLTRFSNWPMFGQ
jgi:hemerythrin-like domain-containing protein